MFCFPFIVVVAVAAVVVIAARAFVDGCVEACLKLGQCDEALRKSGEERRGVSGGAARSSEEQRGG